MLLFQWLLSRNCRASWLNGRMCCQVLASPHNSLVWIQYMAFQLSVTEIEGARAVAERALKAISYRDEQEKLNVWCVAGQHHRKVDSVVSTLGVRASCFSAGWRS